MFPPLEIWSLNDLSIKNSGIFSIPRTSIIWLILAFIRLVFVLKKERKKETEIITLQ